MLHRFWRKEIIKMYAAILTYVILFGSAICSGGELLDTGVFKLYIYTKNMTSSSSRVVIARLNSKSPYPVYKHGYRMDSDCEIRSKIIDTTIEINQLLKKISGHYMVPFGDGQYIANDAVVDCRGGDIKIYPKIGNKTACKKYNLDDNLHFLGRIGCYIYNPKR